MLQSLSRCARTSTTASPPRRSSRLSKKCGTAWAIARRTSTTPHVWPVGEPREPRRGRSAAGARLPRPASGSTPRTGPVARFAGRATTTTRRGRRAACARLPRPAAGSTPWTGPVARFASRATRERAWNARSQTRRGRRAARARLTSPASGTTPRTGPVARFARRATRERTRNA